MYNCRLWRYPYDNPLAWIALRFRSHVTILWEVDMRGNLNFSGVNPCDGIKSVLGYGGLGLFGEDSRTYEDLFWKALREGAMSFGEALNELYCQLSVDEAEAERLTALFNEAVLSRAAPRIIIHR